MTVDAQGLIWLDDPWIAALTLAAVIGLFLWCHVWIATGQPPRPRAMAIPFRNPQRARSKRIASVTCLDCVRAERRPTGPRVA